MWHSNASCEALVVDTAWCGRVLSARAQQCAGPHRAASAPQAAPAAPTRLLRLHLSQLPSHPLPRPQPAPSPWLLPQVPFCLSFPCLDACMHVKMTLLQSSASQLHVHDLPPLILCVPHPRAPPTGAICTPVPSPGCLPACDDDSSPAFCLSAPCL